MVSAVQICNEALIRVSGNQIISLTDNTTEAKLCNTLFNSLVDELSLEGLWSSTIKRATLNQTTTTPTFEFALEYQLPIDPFALKVISLDEVQPGTNKFAIEGDKLLTNMTEVSIKYIARITDTEKFHTGFKRALVSRLAAELALPITGQASVAERMLSRYDRDLADGLASDGQQGSIELSISSALHDVR